MNDQGKPRLVKFYDYHVSVLHLHFGSNEIQNVDLDVEVDIILPLLQDAMLVCKTFATLLTVLQVHAIIDEIVLGGQVLETDSSYVYVVKVVQEITRLEKAANSISLVPKSIMPGREDSSSNSTIFDHNLLLEFLVLLE
ncbi:AP-3 complex subunit sigma-like [Impatiens glandulifera]|uniref:AP-3 complex subunit sigma-like n=1 Tax=Impatiens glandulifera TaxID=253017 RepID=UPI001FB15D90|nr:AP-3 complex subunit sigma-like [Impatiens glandulifera]